MIQRPLRQVGDGFEHLELTGLPIPGGWGAEWLVQQIPHLADRCTTLQPGQDRFHSLDLFDRVQSMPLGCALWLEQPVAPLPCAQGDRVDARAPGQLTNW